MEDMYEIGDRERKKKVRHRKEKDKLGKDWGRIASKAKEEEM